MLVKTEKYVKDGVSYIKEFYGADENNITATHEKPDQLVAVHESEPVLTEQEEAIFEIQANIEYLVCMNEV